MAASTEVAGGRMFPRLHWGAVAAGVLVALAAHVVMGLIGAAIGFAAEPADSRSLGATAAIWALITPFVATLLGAWLASRMSGADDSRSGTLHGVLVWCIGLIAGAVFLAGTMATGAMSAGTAASGNAMAAQRQLRADPGTRGSVRSPQAQARAEDAAKGAAVGAGGGALAAIAGLLGAIVGAGLATRRRRGAQQGRWRTAFRHEERREPLHAGDRGAGTSYGTTYGTTEQTRMPGSTTTTHPGTENPPGDPFHH